MLRITVDNVPDEGGETRRVGQLHIRNLLRHAKPHVSDYEFIMNERQLNLCACGKFDMTSKSLAPVVGWGDGSILNHPRSASPWRLVGRAIEQFLREGTQSTIDKPA